MTAAQGLNIRVFAIFKADAGGIHLVRKKPVRVGSVFAKYHVDAAMKHFHSTAFDVNRVTGWMGRNGVFIDIKSGVHVYIEDSLEPREEP